MAKGLLLAAINFKNVAEDEFHDWYDTEHLPERERVPGFLNAQRWIGIKDANISVAIYDLDTVAVLASPGYTAIGGQGAEPVAVVETDHGKERTPPAVRGGANAAW